MTKSTSSRFQSGNANSGITMTTDQARQQHRGCVSTILMSLFSKSPRIVTHYDTIAWYIWLQIDAQNGAKLKAELKEKTDIARNVNNGKYPTISINSRTFEVIHASKAYWSKMATKEASQYPWIIRDPNSGICFMVNMNLANRRDLSPTIIARADSYSIQRFQDIVSMENYIADIARVISTQVEAVQLRIIHLAVDIIDMPVAIFTQLASLMAVVCSGRKGQIQLRPQQDEFDGFAIGDSTNHRVQFYEKTREIKDKGRSADQISTIISHLTSLWLMDSNKVTRIEFQLKDFLVSDQLARKQLRVRNARDWQSNYAALMTYFCIKKFIITGDDKKTIVHPVWQVIANLWATMGHGMVYRHGNPLAANGVQAPVPSVAPGSRPVPLIQVPPATSVPPSRLPQTKESRYEKDARSILGRVRKYFSRHSIPMDDHEKVMAYMDRLMSGQIPEYQSWD